MIKLKRFNEEVGFDTEDLRDKLEIANLRGELEPGSNDMKDYYSSTKVIDTLSEIKKIIFNYPILSEFHTNIQKIENIDLISFYATSKNESKGDFYCQMSFALKDSEYYLGTIFRERENYNNEEDWLVNNFELDNISDVSNITKVFIEVCRDLGIFDEEDLSNYKHLFN